MFGYEPKGWGFESSQGRQLQRESVMRIALDYDDTYTRDPLMWNWFCQQALDRGHEVWCVSARDQNDMDDPIMTVGRVIGADKCVGTAMKPKRTYMWKEKDVYIDVWIDDSPEYIVDRDY